MIPCILSAERGPEGQRRSPRHGGRLPHDAGKQAPRTASGLEIIAAVVAVENTLRAGKPFPALPDMALAHDGLDDRRPPIVADEDQKPDDPFNEDPCDIESAEKHGPKTAVLAALIGKLNAGAAASRAFAIDRHSEIPPPGYRLISILYTLGKGIAIKNLPGTANPYADTPKGEGKRKNETAVVMEGWIIHRDGSSSSRSSGSGHCRKGSISFRVQEYSSTAARASSDIFALTLRKVEYTSVTSSSS